MSALQLPTITQETPISIHNRAMAAAKKIKEDYIEMFDVLMVAEERQIYFEFEVPDFHTYCVELLELSNQLTKDFRVVVRKSLEVPSLAEAIRSQRVTLSKARKVCSVMTPENSKDWIDLAANCSARIIERTVAMANPREAVQETLSYVSGDVLEFKLAVSEEWSELLARTKDLMSQKAGRNVTSEEALFELMNTYVRKNDPLQKAQRAARHKESIDPASATPTSKRGSEKLARYVPAEVVHAVHLRDEARCSFVDSNGNRCNSRRWLQHHHIVEFAKGGSHTVDNLTTLCWGHHKVVHFKSGQVGAGTEARIKSVT